MFVVDHQEAESDSSFRSVPPRYGGQRFTTPAVELDQAEAFSKPPLVRNPSLSFYESESRHKLEKGMVDAVTAPPRK